MVPSPTGIRHARPAHRYSFSEHTWPFHGTDDDDDDDDEEHCKCCALPRRVPFNGPNFCRLMASVFLANCCLFFFVTLAGDLNLLATLILAVFMTLVAAVVVSTILCIVWTFESGWKVAYSKRYVLYYFFRCKSPVYVPPETLWEVADFLPHRSPLWRTNRLFALRVLEINDWDAYMKRIRNRKSDRRKRPQQLAEAEQFIV